MTAKNRILMLFCYEKFGTSVTITCYFKILAGAFFSEVKRLVKCFV